jgi:putative flippase GtrA
VNLSASALRFALVGVGATLIHVIVAISLINMGRVHPVLSNGLAFIIANMASYAANTRWSFKACINYDNWRRFVVVSLVAWSLTVAIAWVVEAAGGHYMIGISLVVILVPALTFAAHRTFTYRL